MECSLRKLFQLLRSEGFFFLSSSFHTSTEVFSFLDVLGKCRKITNIFYYVEPQDTSGVPTFLISRRSQIRIKFTKLEFDFFE